MIALSCSVSFHFFVLCFITAVVSGHRRPLKIRLPPPLACASSRFGRASPRRSSVEDYDVKPKSNNCTWRGRKASGSHASGKESDEAWWFARPRQSSLSIRFSHLPFYVSISVLVCHLHPSVPSITGNLRVVMRVGGTADYKRWRSFESIGGCCIYFLWLFVLGG